MSDLDRIRKLAGLAAMSVAEANVTEASGTCKHCGCEIDNPTPGCECEHDSHDASGDNWIKSEAVGDSAESFYELQDEFCGGECPSHAHKALIDELVRYLSGDQVNDFVADFRRHYDMNEVDEAIEEAFAKPEYKYDGKEIPAHSREGILQTDAENEESLELETEDDMIAYAEKYLGDEVVARWLKQAKDIRELLLTNNLVDPIEYDFNGSMMTLKPWQNESIREDSDFPRMTPEQAEDLASDVDNIPTDYVDYDKILYAMNLYAALDDGHYGDHDSKENGEFNNLINDWEDLVRKAANMQGREVPRDFGEEGIDIPDDIQREMETIKAKMKAVFKDPAQMRLQFDSKNPNLEEAVSLDQARKHFFDEHDYDESNVGYAFDQISSQMSPKDVEALAQELSEFYPEWYAEYEAEMSEGNEFTHELKKAKDANKDEFEVDGKKYKVESSCGCCGNNPCDCDDDCGCKESVMEAPTMDTTQLITMMKLAGLSEEAIQNKLNEWANTPEGVGEVEPTVHGEPDNYNFAQAVNLSLKRYLDAEDMKVGLKEHKVEDIKAAYLAKKNK